MHSSNSPERPSEQGTSARANVSQAMRIVECAQDWIYAVFHTPTNEPYVAIKLQDGHIEYWSLRGKRIGHLLGLLYHQRTQQLASAPARKDAQAHLIAQALLVGEERPTFLRVAHHDGNIYIDTGNKAWDAIEVTKNGWAIIKNPPVIFRRSRGMQPLVTPTRGTSLHSLREVLAIDDPDTHRQLVAWALAAYHPHGPYPVLVLQGEQGAKKSSIARVLRALTDPSAVPLRSEPQGLRDLMIAASHNRVLVFDNLSYIKGWLSDALCRLSTGGGLGTRALFTDDDEALFDTKLPVILTGITELPTRSDLLDRSIVLDLPAVSEGDRLDEKTFNGRVTAALPGIFGGLLDCLVAALRNLPTVKLAHKPRLADFAMWIAAAEPALGWERGSFLSIYKANCEAANGIIIDSSPIAAVIRQHAIMTGTWTGTASQLLAHLNSIANFRLQRTEGWPSTPQSLSNAIRRLAPNLRSAGVEITFPPRTRNERKIQVKNCISDVVTDVTHANQGELPGPYA